MYKTLKFSKNRQVIFDLLYRAKRFHHPVTSCHEIDCTQAFKLVSTLRQSGQPASFASFLVKATAVLLSEKPKLNRHLFTKFGGRKLLVQFDHVSSNLIIQRNAADGEKILLPLVVREANLKSISEIEQVIRYHKKAPLEKLPQLQAFEKLKKVPRWILSWISYKTRSDPKFYLRYYGTYGLSINYSKMNDMIAGTSLANTSIAFLPYAIYRAPSAAGNEESSSSSRIMKIMFVFDHAVLDGNEMLEGFYGLKQLIENPERLFPTLQQREETPASRPLNAEGISYAN